MVIYTSLLDDISDKGLLRPVDYGHEKFAEVGKRYTTDYSNLTVTLSRIYWTRWIYFDLQVANIRPTFVSRYNRVALQRIHRYNVLFPWSRFHVMENSRSGYNVLSLQRTFFRHPWEYFITRLDCSYFLFLIVTSSYTLLLPVTAPINFVFLAVTSCSS